ncbi:MAG: chromosomal replication initiator protein DnaA, partial [Chloroflexi bacterium]|nr:chromosomal replication initiator protein DnaA [Chloroflexota bacterium]
MTHTQRSPQETWWAAYGDLQTQLPRETFDTWLRDARFLAYEDGSYIIAVRNVYQRDWLEHRLKPTIVRSLTALAGRTVEVSFVVWSDAQPSEDVYEAGPLLAALKDEPEPIIFERLTAGETGLNPRYTLDDLIVGTCNQLAHAAALSIVEAPGEQFNPLYLHGGVGMGKSHLLHGLGHRLLEQGWNILCVTAETFTNDLVAAIRGKRTGEFRAKYREVDVLLVDDVQFIAGKDSTQEEFFHTFEALHTVGAQIVLAGQRPPAQLTNLDQRLRSRFEGGLVVELVEPDVETRYSILMTKAAQRGFATRLSDEILSMIAQETQGSVRDLEGALNRVIVNAMVDPVHPPSIETVAEAISQVQSASQAGSGTGLVIDDILMAVSDYYDVDIQDIMGR